MKRFYQMFLLSLLICSGCKETDESIMVDTLLLSSNRFAVASNGGSTIVAITSSSEWKATAEATWITCTSDSNYLTIKVEPNVEEAIRTAEIAVATSTMSENIIVKQEGMHSGASFELVYDESHCTMDSEGAEFTVTVIADVDWKAEADNSWFTVEVNKEASRFSVKAPQNAGDERQHTTLTVSAGYVTQQIELSQQTRSENVFYALEGVWNWNAPSWYYGNEILGEGVNASCRLETYVYNQQYKLLDLFLTGSGLYVTYDPQTGGFTIPLGWSVGYSDAYIFYICGVDIESRGLSFEGALTFVPESGKLVVKSDVSDKFPYVGIVGYNGQNYTLFNNICYALIDGSVLERSDSQSSVVQHAEYGQIISGEAMNHARKRGYATFEINRNL